jgi:type IV secretion system protein TrbE
MLRIGQVIKPWKESGALNAHISLYGFWNDEVFLTKSGDLGIVLNMRGVDYESLDQTAQEYAVKRLEAALKVFGPGFHIYQYLFKNNRPAIPFQAYDDPVVSAAVQQRKEFFSQKLDRLFDVEIFYAVVIEGVRSKTGIAAALARLPIDPMAALRELRAQFSNDKTKVILREQIEADLLKLEQRTRSFMRQLADLVQIEVLQQDTCFCFFRRLLNYDRWRIDGRPQSGQFLDFQIANSDIEAEREHLRVGDHFVRVLTMKEAIAETKPLVLKHLLEIEANFCIVTEWVPMGAAVARKEITKRKRHFNISKTSFITSMQRDPATYDPRNTIIDESKQADIEHLGDCLRALGEGQALGDFSLTVVLYAQDKKSLDKTLPEIVRVFTSADGDLFAESYNQLNAYFATIPGNYRHNLRRLYLLNSNYADLSFLFTVLPGETRNEHLGAEYLAVLETDHATPYFLNLHNRDVAHTLILGATGMGKSFLAAFILQNAQKYKPLTYVFDIGGSFEALTRIFGGSYLNVGRESRDFTINPFSLEPTRDNLQFLYSLIRVLIEGERYKLDFKEERQLYSAIERIYVLEPEQRTLSNLADIVGELKDRLHRWTRAGQYGFLFDNVKDTLTFSRFQTFNFHGWGDTPELLEPLLFYVLHRASREITDPARLATFKAFLLDEAWLFIRNETIRSYITQAQKTWRKHNAAMILATQSLKELATSGMLTVVAESCATKIFLANPDMDATVYRDAFGLNDTELTLISELVPPRQMLIRKHEGSKKVQLNVDSLSYWMATNNARDNVIKNEYLERFGITEGLRRLTEEQSITSPTRLRQERAARQSSEPPRPQLEGARR